MYTFNETEIAFVHSTTESDTKQETYGDDRVQLKIKSTFS